MSRRSELIQILSHAPIADTEFGDRYYMSQVGRFADYLINNNVVVIPNTTKVYYIVRLNSNRAYIAEKSIAELTVYELLNPSEFGYYLSKEEAENSLRGERDNNEHN